MTNDAKDGKEQYTCNCCSHEREKSAKAPRYLHEIPREALAGSFKKSAPAFLCYYCDGDAYQLATTTHSEEKEKETEGDVG